MKTVFRGLTFDDNSWQYGGCALVENCTYIIKPFMDEIKDHNGNWVDIIDRVPVKDGTLGMWTGELDVNLIDLFEDDIIKVVHKNFLDEEVVDIGIIRYGKYNDRNVLSDLGLHLGFYIEWVSNKFVSELKSKTLGMYLNGIEKIGDIYHNFNIIEEERERYL